MSPEVPADEVIAKAFGPSHASLVVNTRKLVQLQLAARDPAAVVADAAAAGIAPGPAMGAALRGVEAWWIDEDFTPDRPAVLVKLREAAP